MSARSDAMLSKERRARRRRLLLDHAGEQPPYFFFPAGFLVVFFPSFSLLLLIRMLCGLFDASYALRHMRASRHAEATAVRPASAHSETMFDASQYRQTCLPGSPAPSESLD